VSRVFWDTNLFIYLLEDRGPNTAAVTHLTERMLERADILFTSVLTLGELLVHPMAQGNEALCLRYENILSSKAILIPFDQAAARSYASIRQNKSIKPPDAMQLACAARTGIDIFITNDEHLRNLAVPGIQFIASLKNALI
jgi:predicted nucleic acid-binding protein